MGQSTRRERANLPERDHRQDNRPPLESAVRALKASISHFAQAVPRNRAILLFGSIYLLVKVWANVSQGATYTTGLRSAVIGLGVYVLAILVIDSVQIAKWGSMRPVSMEGTTWMRTRSGALLLLLALWAFWLAMIVDSLQRRQVIPGTPILGIVPGWDCVAAQITTLAESIASNLAYLQAIQVEQLLVNIPLRVVLPLALLLFFGYRWRDMGLSFRNWQVALPFLVLYAVAFLVGGPDGQSWTLLGYALIYPALVEEFFYRGLLQRSAGGLIGAVNGLLLAAALFAALHFPDRYFRLYDGNLAAAIGDVADVALAGVFYGYGFMRSGGVLPWALIHALSNVAGI
jgi:membrane protease YdiL (CAAX protease family)